MPKSKKNDTNNLKILKFVVHAMGVILILGIIFLFAVVFQRIRDHGTLEANAEKTAKKETSSSFCIGSPLAIIPANPAIQLDESAKPPQITVDIAKLGDSREFVVIDGCSEKALHTLVIGR